MLSSLYAIIIELMFSTSTLISNTCLPCWIDMCVHDCLVRFFSLPLRRGGGARILAVMTCELLFHEKFADIAHPVSF